MKSIDPQILLSKLESSLQGFILLLPEIILSIGLILLLIIELIFQNRRKFKKSLLEITTLFICGISLFSLYFIHDMAFEGAMNGFFISSPAATVGRFLSILAIPVWLHISSGYDLWNNKSSKGVGELYVFIFAIGIGAGLLLLSSNFLMLYLAIEVMSLSAYSIAALPKNKFAVQSALRYLLVGAVASAIMLYGISLLYGFTGSLNWNSFLFWEGLNQVSSFSSFVAFSMVLAGFLFKITLFPFHIWAPQVYRDAPLPAVAYFSVVPKLASIILLLSIFVASGTHKWQNHELIVHAISVLALVSIFWGNLSALIENDVRKLMAWSSIAHGGFMLAVFCLPHGRAYEALVFYSLVFWLMNFGAFAGIAFIGRQLGTFKLNEWAGCGKHFIIIAILFSIVLVSLVGLPPTAGFTAKILVFTVVWEAYVQSNNTLILALFISGILNAVFSLFYYFKIPYYLFLRQQISDLEPKLPFSYSRLVFLVIIVLVLIFTFFHPDLLMKVFN